VDKELIAMCDCEEVRSKWETEKLGDNVFLSSNNSLHIVSEIKSLDTESIGIKLSGLDGFFDPYYHDDLIFIPRIDDVLEWLNDYKDTQFLRAEFHRSMINTKYLLQVFMNVEHNKTWDGEKWV
jgi:hypothetical protein